MNLINWFLLIYFINDLFKYNYPQQYNYLKEICIKNINDLFTIVEPYTITTMINLLYCYSVVEIKYNKLKTLCKPYISKGKTMLNEYLKSHNNGNPIFCELKTKIEIFDITNNFQCAKVICSSIPIEENEFYINSLIPDIYHSENYYISITNYLENEIANVITFKNILINNDLIKLTNKRSNVQFISLSLIIEDLSDPIELYLKSDEYNYYMVDTKIDKYFIYYYLKYISKYKNDFNVNFENFTFNLSIMDSNINMFSIKHNDILLIKDELYLLELDNNVSKDIDNRNKEIDNMNKENTEINRVKTNSFGEQDYITI